MKSILTASICAAALAMAVPAMAQQTDNSGAAPADSGTSSSKPMHKMHHHMGRHMRDHMQGPKTKSKHAGDPSTDQLNEQSLSAARGGSAPTVGSQPGAMAPSGSGAMAPSGSGTMAPGSSGAMAPGTGTMAPAGSGTPASTTPSNTPGGQNSAGGQ